MGANDEVLFSKEYPNSYEIKRATLFNMKEIVMPERPMVIAEVWPFFVDARVVFSKVADVTEYAQPNHIPRYVTDDIAQFITDNSIF